MTIDSHQHFWNYSAEEYGWIDDSMRELRRDFLPVDLGEEVQHAGIDGVVSVQARTMLEETRWLLELADASEMIRGVVGWFPLESPTIERELEAFAGHPKLLGVREVLQGRTAGALLRAKFNRGVAKLKDHGLAFDLLIFENQLDEALDFVDRHPQQVFVLDHIAKPRIWNSEFEPWASRMKFLALRQNVFCKVSGMVTEADSGSWREEDLMPYFETVLEAFGPSRLMFGSDWPVCLTGISYRVWAKMVRSWSAPLSEPERAELFGGTAIRAYGITS